MSKKKILLLIGIIGCVVVFFRLGLQEYLSLEFIKQKQTEYADYYQTHALQAIAVFSGIYVLLTAVSFPGAAVLTLLAGALFGVVWGTVIVSIASTIGATLAFLGARYLFRESFMSRFSERMGAFNKGLAKDGPFYLFTLRLIPIVPFFVINIGMGLTNMSVWRYAWVSQIGMLPGTFVYVNAGTQLSQIDSLQGIFSFEIWLSLALLALFPFIGRKLLEFLKAKKVYARFSRSRPARFDYNIVAIGAGAAGLVTSYIAAAAKARVALVEGHKMGGDCLNYGCVPSKALIKSARFVHESKKAAELGLRSAQVEFEFGGIMERVHKKIAAIEPHDSVERYTKLGVECVNGFAKILSPWEVQVGDRVLTTRNIVIATGAKPIVPGIEGLADANPLTSENLWELTELPRRLLILGGGYIGCELAQAFARLGSQVIQVERHDRLVHREDPEVSQLILNAFKAEGVDVRLGHNAHRIIQVNGQWICEAQGESGAVRIEFDRVLVALGRQARTEGFGLEELGVELDERGTIKVDERLRTNFPNIYACGDCMSPLQFTHVASHQAWYCAVNAMLAPYYSFKVDYRVIPACMFTDPEVASVGLNESRAKERGIAYEVSTYQLDDLDRAIVDSHAEGFIKVLTSPGSDKILGVTIVGHNAGEIIAEYVTAMKYGLGLNKILGTIHSYPTYAEANKYVAGVWKKNHVNPKALKFAEKFNGWRR